MANLRRKALVGAVTVVATIVATCGVAFANAANPFPDSHGAATLISGTVTVNPDGSYHVDTGTVVVEVGGTWNWGLDPDFDDEGPTKKEQFEKFLSDPNNVAKPRDMRQ
jgi:hypothetical protein